MIGKCIICGEEKEVRGIITAKAFMKDIVGHETGKLITCKECTPLLLEAIRQAVGMVQRDLKPS